uniref:Globin family profile domain-containing protein n=1 Tax=Trichuris muris TaxID=70415 RepID=A0A5S6QFB5_TRIMR
MRWDVEHFITRLLTKFFCAFRREIEMGNHGSLFSSKPLHRSKMSGSYNALNDSNSVAVDPLSMTMSCVFPDEIAADDNSKRGSPNVFQRFLCSKKLFRRSRSSGKTATAIPLSGTFRRKTVSSSAAALQQGGPDFDAIFEHAAQRNDELCKAVVGDQRRIGTPPKVSHRRSVEDICPVGGSEKRDSGPAGHASTDKDDFSCCSRATDSGAWRRAMSLRVTFFHENSLEREQCPMEKTIEPRKTSTASVSSFKDKLCRTSSTRCLRSDELPVPVRRWLSSADIVCDQELLDMVREMMPVGELTPLRRNSSKRSSRKFEFQPLLSPAQIKLIRNHWNGLYITIGPTAIGNYLFNRIVFKNPQSRKMLLSLLVDHLSPGYFSKRHARAIGVILNFVMKNLEYPENISLILKMVGHCHAKLVTVGLDSSIWNVFAEALLECSLEWGEKSRRVDEVRKAWAIIIAFITEKLKAGFNDGRKNLQAGA